MKTLSMLLSVNDLSLCTKLVLKHSSDPEKLGEARSGIPVTTQRRFDVYPDISASS